MSSLPSLSPQPSTRWNTRQYRSLAGYVILSAFVVLLFGFILYEAWVLHSIGGLLVAVVLGGVLMALVVEARVLRNTAPRKKPRRHYLFTLITLVSGAGIAYWISEHLSLGPVAGSALVGLLGALVFPQYSVPIYCGSFVGMSSAALLAAPEELLLAASISGLVYLLAEDTLNGFGGKLGTIAFSGSLLTGLGLQRQFVIVPMPSFDLAWQIVVLAVAAAMLTYWLSVVLNHGPVLASSAVGVVGGLLLPAVFPETGQLLAVVVICASFTGMASDKRFPSPLQMLAAGVFTGIIFLYSVPVFGGTGGKLGTIAFGATLAIWGYQKAYTHWFVPVLTPPVDTHTRAR